MHPNFHSSINYIFKIWKKPVSINKWMDEENVLDVYNRMLVMKKNKIVATTQMDLEGIIKWNMSHIPHISLIYGL